MVNTLSEEMAVLVNYNLSLSSEVIWETIQFQHGLSGKDMDTIQEELEQDMDETMANLPSFIREWVEEQEPNPIPHEDVQIQSYSHLAHLTPLQVKYLLEKYIFMDNKLTSEEALIIWNFWHMEL
jgi:hypothetical protein